MSLILIASLVTAKAGVTLNFHPKVGSTYKYQNTVVQSNPMMGNQNVSSVASMNVKGFTGGYYTIVMTTSNVKITGGRGNSDDMRKLMEGKSMTMSIDKYGAPKLDTSKMSGGMQQMMNGLGGQGASLVYPKKALNVGDTWSNTIDLGSAINAAVKSQKGAPSGMKSSGKLTMNYKLVSVNGSTATISCQLKGSMNMNMGSGKTAPKGQPSSLDMTMTGSGQYSVERSTGMLTTSTMKMNMGVMGTTMSTSVSSKRI